MSTIALSYCPITVDDVDAALPFYRDGLGLEIVNDVSYDGHRWVSFGFAGQPGLAAVVSDPSAGRSPEDAEALQRLIVKGSGPGPYVFTASDLDAVFERLRASGAEVLQEPIAQDWGPRDCAFRDPAGNHIRINQA
ncbi:catechol 2,3-dioxygenase-like lactoylglutathione lyase family enzyme [Microbacterium terrae]|uniref:Glyoxalase-like domain protein n=1 Tax=Microbacterium terrae TaxID=69369 RepID=A0A0M2H6H8_9MICO|nr:VOC family protein [Microbacterium terrae]KJL42097.1 Glyoxalase-like domain protein [Microbacterium terrae]MBP1076640.1 catechol 2,3-dioxygenase-like lactoylglutathione lyase family enzyme [Microbacterium terrae]